MGTTQARRYRFGALERRGVLAGLRAAQLTTLAVAGILCVVSLRSFSSGVGLSVSAVLLVVSLLATFMPVQGRTLDEWIPTAFGSCVARLSGRTSFRSSAPTAAALEGHPVLPHVLRDVVILCHPLSGTSETLGVIKDRRAGTYTGVLAVRGRSFTLLDAADKQRRLASWGSILAGLCREGGTVHRLQWIERSLPDTGDEIGRHLRDNIAVPLDSPIARSYLEVLDNAGPVTQRHEVLLALQVDAARNARAIRSAGGSDQGGCELVRRELAALAARLVGTEITVEGALTPRLIASAIRTALTPRRART